MPLDKLLFIHPTRLIEILRGSPCTQAEGEALASEVAQSRGGIEIHMGGEIEIGRQVPEPPCYEPAWSRLHMLYIDRMFG